MKNTQTNFQAACDSDRLVLENMNLAYHLALRYRQSGVELDDLRGEALLALTLAARSFNPERRAPFAPWAIRYITTYLNRLVKKEQAWRQLIAESPELKAESGKQKAESEGILPPLEGD